jgi:hypothetical protein
MSFAWKFTFVAVFLVLYGMAVWYVKDQFDEADQARLLADQITAANTKQKQVEQRAAQAENALQTERQLSSYINQKWTTERAKNHTDCKLSAGTLELLKAATDPGHDVAR